MKNKRETTRRQFLIGSAAGGLAAFVPASPAKEGATASVGTSTSLGASGIDGLKEAFLNPPHTTKPMTRWWWFGGAATPQEITRELTMMRDAGLRGVELQPVYPLAVDNPRRGIRDVRYFTPEWFDLVRHTLRETQRLGLQLDFTMGSGWPYGGPFIPPRRAAKKIEVLSRDVSGPADFVWDLYPYLTGGGRVFAIVAVPVLTSGNPDVSQSSVITGQLERRGRLHWHAPSGVWKVMVFVESLTGQQVKRPTVGMEGYVLDHFSRRALSLHLDAVGDRTLRELAAVANPPFSSVFCDSLEVFGADWTSNFMDEFKERRGYDLAPFLPALWQEAGVVTPHIRFDYHLTLSDLILENFFQPLQIWSRKHGMTARVQAHGAMGDVMQGYALADTPEGEEGVRADHYSVIIGHRRLASSAGHIYQKPVISCESYTWLRFPLFTVTLEMMKGATDSSFLDGINQIVNQGYSYSPPEAGEPGWVWYASTMVNHNNIWWRHYKHLTRYIQRTAALLLKGVSINPIAVYVPLSDIYAQYGLGSLIMDAEIERHLGPELFMDLRHAGFDFDLVNDEALSKAAHVSGGTLRAGTAVYSAVIVPQTHFMPPESAARLCKFVKAGGFLIYMGRVPDSAPGLKDLPSRTAALREAVGAILHGSHPEMDAVIHTGQGKAVVTASRAGVLKHLKKQFTPDFQIVEAGGSSEALSSAIESVGFCHRRVESADLYFLSNISQHTHDLRIQFDAGHRVPQRLNPEAGTFEETLVFDYVQSPKGKVTEVQIHLDPLDSCFIIFESSGMPLLTRTNIPGSLQAKKEGDKIQVTGLIAKNGEYTVTDEKKKVHRFAINNVPGPVAVSGTWQLTLGSGSPFTLTRLRSWTELPQGKNYSGWGRYETTFEFSGLEDGIEWVIDLGEVHETAEVTLNGTSLGAAWKGLRRLNCRKALKNGPNRLKVEVGNLWIQEVESLPKPDLKSVAETFGIRWGQYGETNLTSTPPSGLLGPVQLIPFMQYAITI